MDAGHKEIALKLQSHLISQGYPNFVGLGGDPTVTGAVIFVYLNGKQAKSDAKALINLETEGFEGLSVRVRPTGPARPLGRLTQQ